MKKLAVAAFVAGLVVATTGCDQNDTEAPVEAAPVAVEVTPVVPAEDLVVPEVK